MNLELWDLLPDQTEFQPEPLDELGQLGFDFMYNPQAPSFPPPSFER